MDQATVPVDGLHFGEVPRWHEGRLWLSDLYAFGDYDVIALVEAPDNVSVAALSLAVTASGALTAIKTTPLMTVEEGMAAMRKGATASPGYRPPGA